MPATMPPSNVTTVSRQFGSANATVSAGPTPKARNRFAAWVTWVKSPPQVSVRALSFRPEVN